MPLPIDTPGLYALLATGEPVLFLQGHAVRLYRARLAQNPSGMDAAMPLAWRQWTNGLWSDLLVGGFDNRILLNRLQEEQLWAEIIAAHPAETAIPPSAVRDLARLARSALQLASEHRIEDRLRVAADTLDTRTFAAWVQTFRERAHRDRLLAPSRLEHALAKHVRADHLEIAPTLHLIDFEQITPAQHDLLEALGSAGVTLHHYALQHTPRSPQVRNAAELTDSHEQLAFAVHLILSGAAATEMNAGGPPRIAVICPDPQKHRQPLERLFRQQLAPELEAVTADLSSTPWHFATEPALSTSRLVADALDFLHWCVNPLPMEHIGQLLISPFLFPDASSETRARFDLSSTRKVPALRGSLSLAGLTSSLPIQDGSSESQPLFPELRSLARLLEQTHPLRGLRSPADWTEQIRKILGAVGWPGDRALSPAEFRAVEAWESLLDLVATLQFNGVRLSFSALLDLLTAEARNLPSPAPFLDAPLQVLRSQDAEGLTFDLTLFLDATEDQLPTLPRYHPLLSQDLQHQLGIGNPTSALAQCRQMLESLARRSGTLYLLASQGGLEGNARLTTFADTLDFHRLPAEAFEQLSSCLLPEATEVVPAPATIPLVPSTDVRGGVDVLRLQAACGFRAFATYRLAADDSPIRSLGLDVRDTGSLLHLALEIFWQHLGSQEALKALTPEERRTLTRASVEDAFARRRLRSPAEDTWTERYLRVLKRRFTNLLLRWLDEELKRSPFTVLAQEQKQTLDVGPIRLSLRPDRIDQVAGGEVFVDYKTSFDLSAKHWLEERPDAPQLPAYALTADSDTLRGIAFAQVRPGKMGWISLSENAGPFPKTGNKQVELAAQLDAWRSELTSLAESFANGDARVHPKAYPHTCQYCAHRLLCRLDPSTLLEQAEENDDAVEDDQLG